MTAGTGVTPTLPAAPSRHGRDEVATPDRWSGRLRRRRPTRSGVQPPPRSAVGATELALDGVAWVLVAAWALLGAVQAVDGAAGGGMLLSAAAVLVAAGLVVVKPAWWPLLPLAALAAATAVSLALAAQSPPTYDAPWFLWQETMFALAGFALTAGRAAVVVTASSLVAVATLLAVGIPAGAVLSEQSLLVAMALISIAARQALMTTAIAADRSVDVRLRAELEAATRRARHDEMLRLQRTFHDTVLNTLSGLRLPGRRDPEQVRSRAAADLAVVTALAAGVDSPTEAGAARRVSSPPAAPVAPRGGPFSAAHVIRAPVFLAAVLVLLSTFGVSILTEGPTRGSWWAGLAAIVALMATVLAVVAFGRPLNGALGFVLALLVPAPILIAGWGGTGCDVASHPLWPIAGSVMTVWLLTLAGLPARWIVVATLSSVVALVAVESATGPTASCTAHVGVVTAFLLTGVGAGLLLRVSLARLSDRAADERHEAALIEQRTAVLSAMDEVRDAHVRAAMGEVVPLLQGLADGSLDPADPAVRTRSDLAERGLRRLLSLGETHSTPGQVCARVAVAAVAAGHQVTVQEFPPVPPLDQADVELAVTLLDAALAAFDCRATVTLTALGEPDGGGGVTMVVNSSAHGLRSASARFGGLRVSQTVFDDETMVEVAWGP